MTQLFTINSHEGDLSWESCYPPFQQPWQACNFPKVESTHTVALLFLCQNITVFHPLAK